MEAAKAEIISLKQRLRQSEAMVRSIDNNNRGQVNSSSEDTVFKMVAEVEALSTQVPEELRIKLEAIVKIGKES